MATPGNKGGRPQSRTIAEYKDNNNNNNKNNNNNSSINNNDRKSSTQRVSGSGSGSNSSSGGGSRSGSGSGQGSGSGSGTRSNKINKINASNDKDQVRSQPHTQAHAHAHGKSTREEQQQQHDDEYMNTAHVDANRLLAELQAAISGNINMGVDDLQDSDPPLPPLPVDDEEEDSFLRSDASFLDRTDVEARQGEDQRGKGQEDDEAEDEDGADMDDDQLRSDAGHNTTFDERELRRHLMDVESSFLPDVLVAPHPAIGDDDDDPQRGADDTYVHLRSPSPEEHMPVSTLLGLPREESASGRSTSRVASRGSHYNDEDGNKDEHRYSRRQDEDGHYKDDSWLDREDGHHRDEDLDGHHQDEDVDSHYKDEHAYENYQSEDGDGIYQNEDESWLGAEQSNYERQEDGEDGQDRTNTLDNSHSGEQSTSTSGVQPSSPAAAAAARTQYRVNGLTPHQADYDDRDYDSSHSQSLVSSQNQDFDISSHNSSQNRSPTPTLKHDSSTSQSSHSLRASHTSEAPHTSQASRASRPTHILQPAFASQASHASSHASSLASPQPEQVGLPPSEMGSILTLNSVHSLSPNRLPRRPSYFSNRNTSTRSYAESVLSPGQLNTDYALQTGGAIPSDNDSPFNNNAHLSHQSARSGFGLSRLPSFGSIASGVSRDSNDDKPVFNRAVSGASVLAGLRADRQLGRLDEEDKSSVLSDPVTPRPPTTSTFSAPTDTVIAQHVQNIRVPDTIARDFHQRNNDVSPERRPQSSSNMSNFQTRPRSSNLTLKEQNSKIDKLTKENFDLKLKIHFLDQALQNRSDEGVKDMINKNVQFQTDLANERKENQSLRRRIRELERRLKEQSEELDEARKADEEADPTTREEMEYEIMTLSEEVDRLQVKITRLSADNMAKEIEKRKLADYISALNDRKGNEQSAAEEESEMWKDLLTTETARREQAEDDARKLREEIVILRSEKAVEANSKNFGIHRLRRQKNFVSRPDSRNSDETADRSIANTASSVTVVEQLKHENAELRRDLGAQTSMLTSRNKERERLQQEIEDLKLLQRKGGAGGSVAGDSILDRSISRQHQRAQSRTSGHTTGTLMSDNERDEWERRDGQLRDQNAALRMNYQDLERDFLSRESYIGELENAVENLESTYDSAVNDLQLLQKERDEALQYLEEREQEALRLRSDYEKLKSEAITAINELEGDLDVKEEEAKRFVSDLKDRNDDFQALQRELRDLSNSLMHLEDDRAAALKRIEALEQELDEVTQELNEQDKKLQEANQKNERFEVQHESLQAEISFLREEQEADKIKIGDLENSLSNAQQSINDEREKMQELEDSLLEERRQREILDDQSKQEVQNVLNDLNVENSKSKDEVRRLRRALSTKEVEAAASKRSLDELQGNLRKTLGDLGGKRTTWIQEIERLQNDLESTMDELERTKNSLGDRDRLLRNRDMLLESSGLESRRLSDLLDKERDARKRDLHQFEHLQRGNSVNNRTTAQHESRMLELETARSSDRRKMALLEQQYREQLTERNNLLLAMWNRLSTLCGVEWARNHALVNGELPSVDVITRSFPSFNKNIVEALRTIEGILGSFKQRIRGVEKTLIKDYQTLSNNLDGRMKRMDFLERAVKDAQTQIEEQEREQAQLRALQSSSRGSAKSAEELARLKQELKVAKAELKFYKQNPSLLQQGLQQQQKSGNDSASETDKKSSSSGLLTPKAIANTLMRHHSSTAIEQIQKQQNQLSNPSSAGNAGAGAGGRQSITIATPPIQPSEQRWIHRLKELEKRLKAEREARLLDRRGARQRLEERSAENEELRGMLEREKERRESQGVGAGSGYGFDGDGREHEHEKEGSVD